MKEKKSKELKTKYIVKFGVMGVYHNNLADAESMVARLKSRGYDDARIETRLEKY